MHAKKWPVVSGVITESSVIGGCGKSRKGYYADVRYDYMIDGYRYANNQIDVGGRNCDTQYQDEAITRSYVKGASVNVYVDPARSAYSLLMVGVAGADVWGGIVVGFLP